MIRLVSSHDTFSTCKVMSYNVSYTTDNAVSVATGYGLDD
jgi:hypothetical protein